MAPNSKARATGDGRSGGKIVRRRRIAAAKTPYDRPTPPQGSPNWLTGLISPARMVASGAGKLLSSFWNPETWSSPSSSSDSDSGSEDGAEGDSDGYEIPSDGIVELHKKNGTSSWMIKSISKEPKPTVRKSETKRLIEQLIMLENFSREECDRLIDIINSRVVDCSSKEGLDAGLGEFPIGKTDDGTPNICSQAIMEAKKWLEEKKVGSSLKSDLEHGTCNFNSVATQHVTEGEVASPVDMAKSYMRARPPWASPSVEHNKLRTPPPMPTELFKEGTPYSKRHSVSAGSWNIQDEIRRLHSKATEDMLRASRTAKIDLASFSPEHKTSLHSLVADKTIEVMKLHESNSLTAPKSVDESVDLAAGLSSHGLSAFGMTQDDSHTEASPSHLGLLVQEQNQDSESIWMVKGEGVASKSRHAAGPELESNQHMVTDVTEFKGAETVNGSTSQFSLSAGLEIEQNTRHAGEGNPNSGRSSYDKLADITPVEGTCQLLTETSIEVLPVNETTGIVTGSQSSSSIQHEELVHEVTQVNTKPSSVDKTGSINDKQPGKKQSRYSRKGRGKGK